ncbi:MAG: HEAT repeat domain-containing protein [Myxococcales bacterium]|nr:HEAT repeat domain-containing protein [Myxococcales bacterium]
MVLGASSLLVGAAVPGCAPQPVAVEGRAEPTAQVERQAAVVEKSAQAAEVEALAPGAMAASSPIDAPSTGDVAFRSPPPRPVITPDAVIAELERVQAENTHPRVSDWTADAGATVAGDPKLASRIAALLREPTSSYLTRSVGIGLLRAETTEHGQAAILAVLSEPVVKTDMMYSSLVLALHSMPRPVEEVVALTESLRASDDAQVRRAATSVLGSQVWALAVSGRELRADELARTLAADLKSSRDPAEQAVLIEALAQGARQQTVAIVRNYARAKDPILRAAAAKGLASDDAAAATGILMKLLVDPAQAVQSAALDSLHWRTLSAAQKKAVRAAIVAGTLRPENEVVLALFVDRHLVDPARAEALAAIAARNVGDERVTDKVRELERG